ncbi:helix-turn-helix domain-containing protein [Nonomuraea fuscirosea]|uniref:helix-turn-helix domain-containing protein n=1 Tax=Nonomuraea fuscirosea TaxID=1291556 RepID=UPI00344A1A3E
MLEVAGLGELEERAYRLLVRAGEADAPSLAEELGLTAEAADAALTGMRSAGLVREVTPGRFAPVAPDVALGPRLVRRQETIDWARQAVEQLAEEYRASARRRTPTAWSRCCRAGRRCASRSGTSRTAPRRRSSTSAGPGTW